MRNTTILVEKMEELLSIFKPLIIFSIILVVICIIIDIIRYVTSSYYKVTHNSYITIYLDLGRRGEYLTYNKLRYLEKYGAKFLFNLYLNKENGETTETDLVLLTKKSVFVIESKNYSGWIFGNESQQMWTQSLPQGKGRSSLKEKFYNPIWQNRTHIKYIGKELPQSLPVYSVIVFSERCTLKKVTKTSANVVVVKRENLSEEISRILNQQEEAVSQKEIDGIYTSFYPMTQVSDEIKKKHIENINNR